MDESATYSRYTDYKALSARSIVLLEEIRDLTDRIAVLTLLQSGTLILRPAKFSWKLFEKLVAQQHSDWSPKDTSQLKRKVNAMATELLKDMANRYHLDCRAYTPKGMKKRLSQPLEKAVERIDTEAQRFLPNITFADSWFAKMILDRRWTALRNAAQKGMKSALTRDTS
ncbi:hypothetical protein BCR43DRAFT_551727 [Syncephalastrum racemosum]|uniref:Uncharacterized protein n=1 Tax=Syncephalastrum racemosum TaxID=13706 RepID=A0A1X2H656_SYNRA|nr:hypothetical protein BCR43DRAFT_551727 [Syncephalastrum racemosum]